MHGFAIVGLHQSSSASLAKTRQCQQKWCSPRTGMGIVVRKGAPPQMQNRPSIVRRIHALSGIVRKFALCRQNGKCFKFTQNLAEEMGTTPLKPREEIRYTARLGTLPERPPACCLTQIFLFSCFYRWWSWFTTPVSDSIHEQQ